MNALKIRIVALALFAVASLAGLAQASPPDGFSYKFDRVPAYTTMRYELVLLGGEVTTIYLSGDHGTNLDVFVYDEFGNLVAYDARLGDVAEVSFTPSWTGRYTVRVRNWGPYANDYLITVN